MDLSILITIHYDNIIMSTTTFGRRDAAGATTAGGRGEGVTCRGVVWRLTAAPGRAARRGGGGPARSPGPPSRGCGAAQTGNKNRRRVNNHAALS